MSVMPIDGSPVHVRIQNYTNKNIKLAVVLHKSEHPKHNQRAVLSWADVPQHGISKKHNTYFGQERHEQSWFSSADLWCVYWLAEDLTIHASRPSGFSDLIENFDGTLLMTTNASSFKEITPHKLLFGLQVPAYHETVDPRALFNYLAPLPNGVRGYDVLQTNDEFPKPVVFPELTASVQACLDNSVHLGSRFKISATGNGRPKFHTPRFRAGGLLKR